MVNKVKNIIYNLYSPANKDPTLLSMKINDTNCIVVFNSHSEIKRLTRMAKDGSLPHPDTDITYDEEKRFIRSN